MKWYQMKLYDRRTDTERNLLTTDNEYEAIQEFKEQCSITPPHESMIVIELEGVYADVNQSKRIRHIEFCHGRLSTFKY